MLARSGLKGQAGRGLSSAGSNLGQRRGEGGTKALFKTRVETGRDQGMNTGLRGVLNSPRHPKSGWMHVMGGGPTGAQLLHGQVWLLVTLRWSRMSVDRAFLGHMWELLGHSHTFMAFLLQLLGF